METESSPELILSSIENKKPSCSTDPRYVTPTQRVCEFPDGALAVSSGKLFCTTCRERLSLKQSIIKGHVKTSKHLRGIKAIASGNVILHRL